MRLPVYFKYLKPKELLLPWDHSFWHRTSQDAIIPIAIITVTADTTESSQPDPATVPC